MNSTVDFSHLVKHSSKTELHDALLRYHQESQWLQQINDLYRRIAGLLDLPALVEAYSIWLAQQVPHDLIGFRDLDSGRRHLYSSEHGPGRRDNVTIAEKLLEFGEEAEPANSEGPHSHCWLLRTRLASTRMVFMRHKGQFTTDEVRLINDSLEIITQPLHNSMAYETIFEQAHQDALTGLPNRLVFSERLPSLMEMARRYKRPLTLAALDLDHFKAVNDTMGHLIGDNVLKNVSEALTKQIRGCDLLVRMGGDEFLLVLPDTSLEDARHLSERICEAISGLNVVAGEHKLGISIGLKQWDPGTSTRQWLEQADDLLYQAKKNGRSRVMQ